MATDPIREPLTDQGVTEEKRRDLAGKRALVPPQRRADTRLREAAAQAGRPPESAATRIYEVPPPTRDTSHQLPSRGTSKVEEIKSRVSDAADEARQSMAETYEQTKQQAVDTYRETRARTADVVQRLRMRSRQIVNDYPLQVIAAAAAVGVVTGVLLRIWRSNRYE